MSDKELSKRLEDASAACVKAYDNWSKDKKDRKALEELQESVHELRKVTSRFEIEMAMSESSDGSKKPIPIPTHRDSTKRGGNKNDDRGNRAPKGDGGGNKPRKPAPKKAAGGDS